MNNFKYGHSLSLVSSIDGAEYEVSVYARRLITFGLIVESSESNLLPPAMKVSWRGGCIMKFLISAFVADGFALECNLF